MSLTAIDAFCGAGGLSLGLSAAGFDVRLGFDNDPRCIETLRANTHRIRHAAMLADVRELTGSGLFRASGIAAGQTLDLLAGGPPCQGFSVQRTIGEDVDERNLLVDYYGDLLLETRPRALLLENVPGLGGKRGRHTLDRFKERLTAAGYSCHERVLDAQDYGVPQRRRRLFVVGLRSGAEFEWPPPMRGTPPTVREVIGDLPSPPANGEEHPSLPGHRADRLSMRNKERLSALRPGQGRTHLPDELLADCHKIDASVVGHRNVYGRMEWDSVAPTITARFDSFTRGQFGHPEELRSISLLEGALLQSFPADYKFVGTKVERARQIGNAVPPRLAEHLGKAIARALVGE